MPNHERETVSAKRDAELIGHCEEERSQRLILYLICLVAGLNRALFKREYTAHNGSLSSTWCPIAQMYCEVALPWPRFQCGMGESEITLSLSAKWA